MKEIGRGDKIANEKPALLPLAHQKFQMHYRRIAPKHAIENETVIRLNYE
jgi:hypothetical protein